MAISGMPKITANTPALAPPPGVKPNFTNPHGLEHAVIIVNTVGITLMMSVYLIRVYSKRVISKQRFDWADVLCAIAVLGSIAHTGLCIYNTTQGFGLHLWDIRIFKLAVTNTKIFSAVEVIYVITIYFVKIALLMLFWQFFRVDILSRRMMFGGFVGCTIITVPYLIVAVIRVSECIGTKALTVTICQQRQISITNLVFGGLNALTDFYILAIPISQLRKLHISTKKKIGVMATFTTGFIACSMSIIRLGFVVKNFYNHDVLHTGAFMSMLGSVEMKLAIVCGCLVYMPAFLKQGKTSLSAAYTYLSRSKVTSSGSSTSKSDTSSERKRSTETEKLRVVATQRPYDELSLPEFQAGTVNSDKSPTRV